MTKELQTIQRKSIEDNVSLGRTDAFANTQNAFDRLSSFGTKAATQIAVEDAKSGGASFAIDSFGEPQKLAPGLTAATRAYNNAYNNVTTDLLGIEGEKLIKENLRKASEPGNLNANSMSSWGAVTKGTIEGILSQTPDNLKADVSLKLMSASERAGSILADRVSSKNVEDMNAKFASILTNNLNNLRESRLGGDIEGFKLAKSNIEGLIQDRKALGLISVEQEEAMRKSLNDAAMSAEYSARLLESRIAGNHVEFLDSLAVNKPEDLTFEQWDQVRSQVLKLNSEQNKLVAGQESLATAQWNQKMITGEVQTLSDLEPAQNEMSALGYVNLQNSFMAKQAGAAKLMANVSLFHEEMVTNPSKANRATTETKNEWYNIAVEASTQARREQTGDPNYELSLPEKAVTVAGATVPIPAFNDEMNYALMSGDAAQSAEVLRSYTILAGNPDTLEGRSKALSLDTKAEQIAVSALLQSNFGGSSFEKALIDAREGILNVSSELRQSRLAEYNSIFAGGNGKKLNAAFKDAMGVNASDNSFAVQVYRDLLRNNSGSMRSVDEAKEFTKQQMHSAFSKSKYNDNEDELMMHSPEKVMPYIDNGQWFNNQKSYAVRQIALNQQKARDLQQFLPQMSQRAQELRQEIADFSASGEDNPQRKAELSREANLLQTSIRAAQFVPSVSVEWGHDFDLPENPTEEDLMKFNLIEKGESSRRLEASFPRGRPRSSDTPAFKGLSKVGDQLKIDGKVRDIFLLSDITTTSRENGRPTWGMYYKDDFGQTQPVPDPFSELGVAEFAALQFDEFMVGTAKELSDKTIREVSEKEASAIFERDNPKRPFLDNFSGIHAFQREGARRQFVEERSPDIEELLKSKRDGKGADDGGQ